MRTRLVTISFSALVLACGKAPAPADAGPTPSDDPKDYAVDTSVEYVAQLGDAGFIIPSHADPAQTLPILASNNNVDIHFFGGRLWLAWRNGLTHFASQQVKMNIISSDDLGATWRFETQFDLGTDMREPHFLEANDGVLRFNFFQAGTNMLSFDPKTQWRTYLQADGGFAPLESWGLPEEITWDVKRRGGVIYRGSYRGPHYDLSLPADAGIEVYFTQSTDGLQWQPTEPDAGTVYVGGVSEFGWEFDEAGTLWAVLRNEDGDTTGFGSNVCTAQPGHYGTWECAPHSDPNRYDSPRMFRHGKDLYLVARRDLGGPFDEGWDGGDFGAQKLKYLLDYSSRPKRSALYQIDQQARQVVWLFDLPSAGDTAFPGIARLDAHTFLIANYTSPIDMPDLSWLQGQVCDCGTKIYLTTIHFAPK
ncbi:MAG: hypothetical protein QM723_25755 [Myxococcaceae bacterium]